jgi:hypothetical protein
MDARRPRPDNERTGGITNAITTPHPTISFPFQAIHSPLESSPTPTFPEQQYPKPNHITQRKEEQNSPLGLAK